MKTLKPKTVLECNGRYYSITETMYATGREALQLAMGFAKRLGR